MERERELTGGEVEDSVLSDVVHGESREGLIVFCEIKRARVECVDTVVHQRMRLDER